VRKTLLRLTPVLAAVACLIALGTTTPATASASPSIQSKTSVSLTFEHYKIKARSGPQAKYSIKHLRAGSSISLQRQFGTAHAWRTVKRLHHGSGTVRAPAIMMGKYNYRIRVTRGRTTVVSRVRTVFAYGTIKFAILCTDWLITPCTPNTVQIGDNAYAEVEFEDFAQYPSYNMVLDLNSTSCDHLHMSFATSDTTSGDKARLKVLQSTSDPVNASTPEGTIGTLSANLNGGPLIVDATDDGGFRVYVNGNAACYSPSGRR